MSNSSSAAICRSNQATAFGLWRATRTLTLSASLSHVWEGDATRDDVLVANSGARRFTVGVGAGLRHDTVLWTLSAGVDPWADHLGENATATVRLTLGATWGLAR